MNLTLEPVLKHQPTDFLVREVLVPRTHAEDQSDYEYLLLAKTGFTTMEAIRMVADQFGLASTEVTYGGLKDEDGVTEQLVAMPRGYFNTETWESGNDAERRIRLRHYGFGMEPLRIGGLEGNAFRIVLRNLPYAVGEAMERRRKSNHCFLNYYDIQRFGVPGGPRRTHLVGTAMLAGRYDDALRELIALRAPESALARAWTGSAASFFADLDPRNASFYLAAHSSAEWNAELRQIIADTAASDAVPVEVEGLPYTYLAAVEPVYRIQAKRPNLAYRRYSFVDGKPSYKDSTRPTVIQTQVAFGRALPDEFFADRCQIELRFFLPSGCYATAAVRQLLARRDVVEDTRG